MGLAIAGVLSQMASYFVYGFAQNAAQVFIAPAISIGETIPVTVLRGETSRLLGPDQQGPLFAALGVVESIGFTLGSPVFLPMYKSTQDFITGTVDRFSFSSSYTADPNHQPSVLSSDVASTRKGASV